MFIVSLHEIYEMSTEMRLYRSIRLPADTFHMRNY